MTQQEIKSSDSAKAKSTTKAKSKANGKASNATPDELLEAIAAESFEIKTPSTTGLQAFRDIFLVVLLFAGGIYMYHNYVTIKEEVAKLAGTAVDQLEKDSLIQLQKAEKTYKKILALDAESGTGLAGIAETYAHMTRQGDDKMSAAKSHLQRAIQAEAKNPERYAASAYLKILEGNPAGAEAEMKGLLDQNLFSPKIAHAYGWALLEQGKYLRANQVLRQAIETDFNAVRFPLTLAKVAHRQGRERAAIKSLTKVLDRALNPEHGVAMAWAAALRAKNYGNLTKPTKLISDLQKLESVLSPQAKAYRIWAEGELNFAMLQPKVALEKAEAAEKALGTPFPPVMSLKARALKAQGKVAEAIATYEAAIAAGPEYRSIKWELARLKSEQKDDAALDIITGLEKSFQGMVGAEFEIFRGDHYASKGDFDKAREAYTKAADLGNDAEILLGLAKVTFLEEKKKGKKADTDKIALAIQAASDARKFFPKLNEFIGYYQLWNWMVPGVDVFLNKAADQLKRTKRPVPELVAFYDRVIGRLKKSQKAELKGAARKAKRQAKKLTVEWEQKKADYLASVLAGAN
jgi:tetratricopeptide (TPR) repeat protein